MKQPKLHFQRFEFKYHLPIRFADKIIPALLNHMQWDPYIKDKNTNSYDVHSIYFDSPSYKNYYEKIEGNLYRKKIRLRSYCDKLNGKSVVFAEIKRKYGVVIIKDRITLPFSDAVLFDRITKRIKSKNGHSSVLDEFLTEKIIHSMRPKVLVSYKRKPLIGKELDTLRVTFDYDIKATPVTKIDFSKHTKHIFENMLIMEIKFNNTLPYWLHEIIQQYALETWPYSKYCNGIDSTGLLGVETIYQNKFSNAL